MNIHVDTLEYANVLVKSGMERAQAEAVAKLQAQTVKDLIDHELVTKDDLDAGLNGLELKLRDEIRSESSKLRDEMRAEGSKLREEMRGENSTLRDEMRGENSTLREELRGENSTLREEMRDMRSDLERKMDTLMVQIRALQLGGAIAAFAIAAIVFMTRLIR